MTPEDFREIRQALGLSQWQLSQALQIRPETISRAETGAKHISRKLAQRLLDHAGIAKCPSCGQSLPSDNEPT